MRLFMFKNILFAAFFLFTFNGCVSSTAIYNEEPLSYSRLNNADKIIIKTNKGYIPKKHIVVKDQNDIKFFVSEIKNIKEIPFILLECRYSIQCFSGNNKEVTIGLSIDMEYPDSSFIRYRTKDDLHDYSISHDLFEYFVSVLDL